MPEIIWEDPPDAVRGRGRIPHWDILRANPGRWARVPVAYNGNLTHRKSLGFQLVSRMVDGASVTYARYVGEAAS